MKKIFILLLLTVSSTSFADDYISVEDNIKLMDTDKNGFADVFEVRAYLEIKNGKLYQTELFNDLESKVGGNSCSTVFSQKLYN